MKSGFLSKLGGQTGNSAKVSKAYLEGTKHGACRAGAPCGEDHAGISLDAEGASWKGSSSVESIRTAAKQEILSEAVRGAVEIGWDDERGNIALARRDYKAGEIVFSDDPIMVVDLESFPPGTQQRSGNFFAHHTSIDALQIGIHAASIPSIFSLECEGLI